MKIVRLSTFLDFGGIETKMANLSSFADENDWVFCAIGKGGTAAEKIRQNNKRVACLNLQHTIPNLSTILKLAKFLRKEKPDIVHTSGAESNFFGFIAAKLAGVPKIIVEEIGIPKHSSTAKKIFGYIFRNANMTVGESQIVVDNLIKNYKVKPERISVVHNFGVFNYNFAKIKKKHITDEFKILMVSRLEPIKNIEGVINVLAKLVDQNYDNIHLTIAGTGSLENDLKLKVRDLSLENYVSFIGLVNDPYPYLVNSNLYILNSFSEGFSNSLVEAMYCGTPSLSTNVGATSEIIEDGKNGFIVPVDNEKELLKKIKIISTMPVEQLASIGIKGQKQITDNFSLGKHVDKLMKLYKN